MSFKKEVLKRLDAIGETQIKHSIELSKNTHVLEEHHIRSSQLEARIAPLERSHIFFNQLAKALAGLATVGTGLAAIIKYLFKF